MKHLIVFCEGQTERNFCAQVLRPHLFPNGDGIVHTLAVGRNNNHHVFGIGGGPTYHRLRKFIHREIKAHQQGDVYFTTLIDLYALSSDFPGKAENQRNPANPTPYILALEKAFETDVDHHRFVGHIQLHEYETMLFADPAAFAISFENCQEKVQALTEVADLFASIELIDDGRETAPSKRIIAVFPEYRGRKTTAGPDIAEFIGLAKIRAACPHFDRWIIRLEQIPWV